MQNRHEVRVVVGRSSDVEIFYEDKRALCKASLFFQHALNGPFMEAHTKVLHLPEANRDTFRIFSVWVATGRLPSPEICKYPKTNNPRKSHVTETAWDFAMSKAMVFAHELMLDGFGEDLRKAFFNVHFPKVENSVDGWLRYFHSFPVQTTLIRIFHGVPQGTILARQISDAILIFFEGDVPFRVPFGLSLEIQKEVLANGTIYKEDEYGLLRVGQILA